MSSFLYLCPMICGPASISNWSKLHQIASKSHPRRRLIVALVVWNSIRLHRAPQTTHQVTLSGSHPGNYQKTSQEFVKLLFQEVYLAWSLRLQADNTNISPPWYLPLSVAGFGSGSRRTLDIKSHHFNSMSRSMLSRTWLRHQHITMMMLCCMWDSKKNTHNCPLLVPHPCVNQIVVESRSWKQNKHWNIDFEVSKTYHPSIKSSFFHASTCGTQFLLA